MQGLELSAISGIHWQCWNASPADKRRLLYYKIFVIKRGLVSDRGETHCCRGHSCSPGQMRSTDLCVFQFSNCSRLGQALESFLHPPGHRTQRQSVTLVLQSYSRKPANQNSLLSAFQTCRQFVGGKASFCYYKKVNWSNQ